MALVAGPRHREWTRAGRKLDLPAGQRAYKGFIGQQNLELADGSFAPYLWNDDSRTLYYADVEARFRGGAIEFWRDGRLQATTRPRLQRRTHRGWVDEDARVRLERLSDEDELRAVAYARIAIVLESPRATARHILVAGCRSRARGDTQLVAHLPGEYRVVLEHDLGGPIETARQPLVYVPSAGFVAHTSALGWRVAWTEAEDRDRTVRVTDRGLAIELPSVRRERGQRQPAEQWISPDTYGPAVNAGGGDDCIADEDAVLLNGLGAGAGTYQYWLGIDDNDDIQDVVALRFGSVDLTGATSITSATLFNDRGGVNRNQGTHTVRTRCQASNTPTTPTGDISVGENPRTRTYLSAFSDNSVPASTADLILDVTTATQGCLDAGYSYTGNSSHAIFYGIGGNQMFGIATVSWSHICWDATHPTADPSELTIVYETDEGGVEGELTSALGDASLVGTGAASVAATLGAALSGITASSEGTVLVAGTLANALESTSIAVAGALHVTGSADVALGDAVAAGAGASSIAASANVELEAATLLSTSTAPIIGATDVVLDGVTVGATGAVASVGSFATVLEDAEVVATAALPIAASFAIVLDDAVVDSDVGVIEGEGSLVASLDSASLVASAGVRVAAVSSVTLDGLALVAEAATPIAGALSASLDAASAVAVGTALVVGSFGATLSDVALTSTGEGPTVEAVLGVGLDAVEIQITGVSSIAGSVEANLSDAGLVSSAFSSISAEANPTLAPSSLSSTATSSVVAIASSTLENAVVVARAEFEVPVIPKYGRLVAVPVFPNQARAVGTAPLGRAISKPKVSRARLV